MDHDRLFKDLLTTFFAEFLELFFPTVAAELDREHVEFLDKEVFPDSNSDDRNEVDLLARVRLSGKDAFILIHIEHQSTARSDFPQRMYRYFAMLDRRFDQPVFPIAIFSYDRPVTPAVHTYTVDLFGYRLLQFDFQAVQLNRMNWRDFLHKPNPVASALMSKMKFAIEDRPYVKLECLRMMLTLKLNPGKSALINSFMKSYLALTGAEKAVYDEAVDQMNPAEKEIVMNYITEWEEAGIEKGLEKGLQLGRAEATLRLVTRQLQHRFGQLPSDLLERVSHLSEPQLSNLAEALLDFTSAADIDEWMARL